MAKKNKIEAKLPNRTDAIKHAAEQNSLHQSTADMNSRRKLLLYEISLLDADLERAQQVSRDLRQQRERAEAELKGLETVMDKRSSS